VKEESRMGEKMVNFVAYKNGESYGCQTAWFENITEKIEEKAKFYKKEHAMKPDDVIIFIFDDEKMEFIKRGNI
jgi:hypothetical protein